MPSFSELLLSKLSSLCSPSDDQSFGSLLEPEVISLAADISDYLQGSRLAPTSQTADSSAAVKGLARVDLEDPSKRLDTSLKALRDQIKHKETGHKAYQESHSLLMTLRDHPKITGINLDDVGLTADALDTLRMRIHRQRGWTHAMESVFTGYLETAKVHLPGLELTQEEKTLRTLWDGLKV